MGRMKHNAIVVTSWSEDHARDARILAITYFGRLVSPIIKSEINAYNSFFIAPDGSKEGWEDSDKYNDLRPKFIKEVSDLYVDCVDVSFGGDDEKAKIQKVGCYQETPPCPDTKDAVRDDDKQVKEFTYEF